MKKTYKTLLTLILVLGLVLGVAVTGEAKTATRLTMSRRTLTMDWGTEFTLSVATTPTNASDRNLITWAEGDDPGDLITCTPDATNPRKAKITVRAANPDEPYPTTGSVKITAMTPSGKSASCLIYVNRVTVSKIEVTPSAKTVYFTAAAPFTTYQMPTPKFTPSVAGDRTSYSWSSDNEAVAEVDESSGLVTFKGEGRAKITATYTAAAKILTDYCVFTVKPVRVKSISIKKDGGTTADTLYYGEDDSFTLHAALVSASSGKRPSYEKVTWTSDHPEIVEVGDSDGDDCQFTCKSSGIATITATTDTGRYVKTARCTVYVRDDNPTRVTITAGGDCVLGGDPRTTGITARSTQREYEKLIVGNSIYPFEKIPALFNSRDNYTNLSIINLEVCLTSSGGSNPSTLRKFLFRGSPKNAQALAVGIDIANIANNHTADFGPNAFGHTAKNVVTYGGGALPSGYNRYNTSATPAVTLKEVDGKRIGFYGVQANQVPVSVLSSRIKKYRKDYNLDMMVVTIHWTGQAEYKRPVTSTMKTYARAAVNAGADLVIGHHRHEMSGIEKYKGKYILYDMGSLVTGGGGGQYTCMVQVDFQISSSFTETAKESVNGPDQIRIYPLCTTSGARYAWNSKTQKYSTKLSNNWQPVPAEDAIYNFDKDTGNPVLDSTMDNPLTIPYNLIKVINDNSPTGPDGSRFVSNSYIKPYSTLLY